MTRPKSTSSRLSGSTHISRPSPRSSIDAQVEMVTIEINSKDQVILNGVDECEGMFSRGEIGSVRDATGNWELLIGWRKRQQKYWITINGKSFDDMDAVPGKQSTEEESKTTDKVKALKLKLRTQLTLPTRTSSMDAGEFDNDVSS